MLIPAQRPSTGIRLAYPSLASPEAVVESRVPRNSKKGGGIVGLIAQTQSLAQNPRMKGATDVFAHLFPISDVNLERSDPACARRFGKRSRRLKKKSPRLYLYEKAATELVGAANLAINHPGESSSEGFFDK